VPDDFDLFPCGAVTCDGRGIVTAANDFFVALCGYSRDGMVGQPFHRLLTVPSRFIFSAQTLPLLTHVGRAREVTLDIAAQGGGHVAVLLNADYNRTRDQYRFAIFPASDRRTAERELARTRKDLTQYRDYLEMAEKLANVGHWHIDLISGAIKWSPETYAIFGCDPSSFSPTLENVQVFYHSDDRGHANDRIDQAVREKSSFSFRVRIIRIDGEIRIIQSHGVVERDAHDVVTGLFGVCRDITSFVRNQEKLEQSESRYRLLANKANDIITVFDLGGVFQYVSPAITKVLGYDPVELTGRNVRDIVHPDDFPHTEAAYHAYVVGKDWSQAPRIRYRARHKDGHWVWAEAYPTAILDAGGTRVTAFQDVVRDISMQKATEEALAQASLEANAAAEAKAQFLATMSHELRTPLTSIIGFSSLLCDLLDGRDDLQRHATRIHTAGQGLLALINDILDHSKLEAGQLELDLEETSVTEVVEDVVAMLELQARAKGLTLETSSLDALPPTAMIDAARVRQILLNLVGNAVKFTTRGSVTLIVRQTARRLLFIVRDTGPGISDEGQKRLFQRFSQVDGRSSGGTGLGLSICKQLTELMNGTISVTSQLGHGAEFHVDIPLPLATMDDNAMDTAPLPPRRILVVDDHEAVADLLVHMLRPNGHDITVANNGYEAVEACQRARFDLILMDINMPVMDGFAAARAIRSGCALNAEAPILALTAAGGAARQQACLTAGMNAVLPKPITVSTLMNAVTFWTSAPVTADAVNALAERVSASLS